MLSQNEIAQIKATVPVLRESGVVLTTHFYKRMFEKNPELKNVFNMGNQGNTRQQTALAMAVLAYAENIENPGVLLPVLQMIGEKHTSLKIEAAQYEIVGMHLLASIKKVLGESASEELINAWGKAYGQLADIMINLERSVYLQKADVTGGWYGWRKFIVKEKIKESDEIISFYLYPEDNGRVSKHKPGQYISIRVFLPEEGIYQPRQYSISSEPNNSYYRISVKRESGKTLDTNGKISNYLHDHITVGNTIEATAPAGVFTLSNNADVPVVLLSGGVGQTPFMSMVSHLLSGTNKKEIVWLHGCRNENVHAFKNDLIEWTRKYDHLKHVVFYEHGTNEDSTENCLFFPGRLDVNAVKELILLPNAAYYICGPTPFLQKSYQDLIALGVAREKIFHEEFGPQTIALN